MGTTPILFVRLRGKEAITPKVSDPHHRPLYRLLKVLLIEELRGEVGVANKDLSEPARGHDAKDPLGSILISELQEALQRALSM